MKNKLKEYRKCARLSLDALSTLCGISKNNIHDLEKQTAQSPKLVNAYLLANVFNVSVYELWPDETDTFEETVIIRRVAAKKEANP